ncbi:helix-turn-helix domain-containing protein [Parasutterella excrementihominis]|jgi:hypothetical protein|uniref:helix-turn-helix domain-containing protein n=1 Tax=Parasutterella excrementihominis TaxID=487175 RepID=UPI00248B0F31|nr:helix-turn-helix domain-containing protein [Parasutterella excrementihominis]
MSFEAIKWAINQDIDDPKEKLLLVILSDFLNDRTRQCNPSRETLMRKACIKNNKTLSSKLDSLVSKGLIEIVRGKGISNRYLVQNRTTFNSEPSSAVNHVQHCTTTRFSSEPTPSSAVNHEPISEPIKEPNTLSKEREDKNFSLTPTEKKVSKKQTAAKKEKKGPYPYSENDPIPDEFLKIAQANNIQDPQELFKKMVLWCQANGRPYKNWKAGFTTWCLREVGYQKEKEQKKQTQASKQNQFSYEPPGGFTDDYYRDQCEFDENGNLKL